MLLFALLFTLLSPTSWVSTTYAQSSNVVCPSQDAWMTNSMGQNPCLVTAWLWFPCYGTSKVDTIPAGFQYIGPSKSEYDTTLNCQCNTVSYSLLAACAICQGVGIQTWPIYSTNCTRIYNGSYPEPIPGGTAVPAWAFLDVIVGWLLLFVSWVFQTLVMQRNSTFNVDAAKSLAAQGLPDTTSEGSSASTSPISSSPTPTPTSPTPSMDGNGPHSTRNVGAIVSGVIGAVTGLLLVGVLAYYVILRRRRRVLLGGWNLDRSSQTPAVRELPAFGAPSYHVPTLSDFSKGTSSSSRAFYDPDDPRTYPTDPSRTHLLPARGGTGSSIGYNGHPQITS